MRVSWMLMPGAHAWDGSYTDLTVEWKGHMWRAESGWAGQDLVLLVTPLAGKKQATRITIGPSVSSRMWK